MTAARVLVMLTAEENCKVCDGGGLVIRTISLRGTFHSFKSEIKMCTLCDCVSGSATKYAEAERRSKP